MRNRTAAAIASIVLATGLLAAPGAAGAHAHPRECATPSIDRLQQWLASGEGTTIPATGSMLVPARQGYAAKIEFVGAEWHVAVVWLGNEFEAQADLTRSAGFRLTYSATDDLWVQLRPASHWSGGAQWATAVPSTGGRMVTRFFSFREREWGAVPELGAPAHTFASALSEARGFVFVGKTANKIEFRGLRIQEMTSATVLWMPRRYLP